MKYKVLTAEHSSHLEVEVNKSLSSGWILQGGVSISKRMDGFHGHIYAQALTKVNP